MIEDCGSRDTLVDRSNLDKLQSEKTRGRNTKGKHSKLLCYSTCACYPAS